MLRNSFERDSEIWTDSADWEESLNKWKETEKGDWETAGSESSVEGGEVDSNNKSNLTQKIMKKIKIQIDRIVPYLHVEFLSRQTLLQNFSPTTSSQTQNLNQNYQRETLNNFEK